MEHCDAESNATHLPSYYNPEKIHSALGKSPVVYIASLKRDKEFAKGGG